MEQTPTVEHRRHGQQIPEGAPPPTLADPTAGGTLCGARRRPGQIEQDREANPDVEPWPYCRRRAGAGTDHTGAGQCKDHGGSTPSGRKSARLRLAELADPAIAALGRVLVDPKAPHSAQVRAAEAILDRAGFPRRLELDTEAGRETLVERLSSLQQSREAES